MKFTEHQFEQSFRTIRDEISGARERMKYAEAVSEAMAHIMRGERPFRHDYMQENHHNGDEFATSDIVWSIVKPTSRGEDTYTLVELPEYEEAMKRLSDAPAKAPIVDPQRE